MRIEAAIVRYGVRIETMVVHIEMYMSVYITAVTAMTGPGVRKTIDSTCLGLIAAKEVVRIRAPRLCE